MCRVRVKARVRVRVRVRGTSEFICSRSREIVNRIGKWNQLLNNWLCIKMHKRRLLQCLPFPLLCFFYIQQVHSRAIQCRRLVHDYYYSLLICHMITMYWLTLLTYTILWWWINYSFILQYAWPEISISLLIKHFSITLCLLTGMCSVYTLHLHSLQ